MKLLDKILNTRNTENKSSNIITEYYLNLIDNSPAEISLIEMRDGPNRFNICHVNKHKCENFGLNPDEIIGKKCFEIFEP
ncbi:MAG: hypothetical protein JXJ22_04685, partial [Bacteroidales bacterium]|nr:hypothetical protein [Bacteroidales bacterium]